MTDASAQPMNDRVLTEKIQFILKQTDYSEETALGKLRQFQGDEVLVLKDYFGVPCASSSSVPKSAPSVNQAIYQQIRRQFDGVMRGYRERVEKGEARAL